MLQRIVLVVLLVVTFGAGCRSKRAAQEEPKASGTPATATPPVSTTSKESLLEADARRLLVLEGARERTRREIEALEAATPRDVAKLAERRLALQAVEETIVETKRRIELQERVKRQQGGGGGSAH